MQIGDLGLPTDRRPAALNLHDLRHGFASALVSKGQSLEVIGAMLGHSQISTTARYSHLYGRQVLRALPRFALDREQIGRDLALRLADLARRIECLDRCLGFLAHPP